MIFAKKPKAKRNVNIKSIASYLCLIEDVAKGGLGRPSDAVLIQNLCREAAYKSGMWGEYCMARTPAPDRKDGSE